MSTKTVRVPLTIELEVECKVMGDNYVDIDGPVRFVGGDIDQHSLKLGMLPTFKQDSVLHWNRIVSLALEAAEEQKYTDMELELADARLKGFYDE